MDLFIALSAIVWAAGGAFSAAWIFWLDRERRELSLPLKIATLPGWPVLFPFLLYEREDLTLWQAGRNALVGLMILCGPPVVGLVRSTMPVDDTAWAGVPGNFPTVQHSVRLPTAGPGPSLVLPTFAPSVSENDRRKAVRYWNSGIIFYQKADYEKARDEWQRCKQLDPSNSDCVTGLQRIDQSYGP